MTAASAKFTRLTRSTSVLLALLLATSQFAGAQQRPSTAPLPGPQRGEFQLECPPAKQLDIWFKPIDQVSADLAEEVEGRRPLDCSQNVFRRAGFWTDATTPTTVFWAPINLAHQPLYWDEIPLERHGQTISPLAQPLISAAQFYATFPVMPYKIGLDHPFKPVYELGYFRPGSPTPPLRQRIRFELDAATLQAGAVMGAILLLP